MTNYTKLVTRIEEIVHGQVYISTSEELQEARAFLKYHDVTEDDLEYLEGLASHYMEQDGTEIANRAGFDVDVDESFDAVEVTLTEQETGKRYKQMFSYYSLVDVNDAEQAHKVLLHHDSPWFHDRLQDNYAIMTAIEWALETVDQCEECV